MRNIKIGTRLSIGFSLIMAFSLIIAVITIYRTNTAINENVDIQIRSDINNTVLNWVRNTESNGERTKAAYLTNDENIRAQYQAEIKATSAKIDQLQDKTDAMIESPEARELFKKILEARKNYVQNRNQALANLGTDKQAEAENYIKNGIAKDIGIYVQAIDNLANYQIEHEHNLFQASQAANQASILITIIITAIIIIVSIILSLLITRSITIPLKRSLDVASSIANKDLSIAISPTGKDEVATLGRALQDMIKTLQQTVGEISSGARSIATASAQISAGNLDLSSRTEEQASSLAETAATMEQITATVRQNADNTQQANSLAAAAAKTATEGGHNVNDLVSTMGEINTKSQQVADIISVIDSIAFQTNILALNAAVEAARAGEQGRGFAVVASEVRALAQRSAASAKEIKDLIDASVESAAKGNEQAEKAGTTMQEIVESINRVTDIMGEINAANREQTTGIEEINTAVTQMDDVTRQNASLVEESAAAASSLQQQADTLASLVNTFNLGSQQAAGNDTNKKPAQLPMAGPEKLIKPAIQNTSPEPQSQQPALRSPTRPAPKTADIDEWTEF